MALLRRQITDRGFVLHSTFPDTIAIEPAEVVVTGAETEPVGKLRRSTRDKSSRSPRQLRLPRRRSARPLLTLSQQRRRLRTRLTLGSADDACAPKTVRRSRNAACGSPVVALASKHWRSTSRWSGPRPIHSALLSPSCGPNRNPNVGVHAIATQSRAPAELQHSAHSARRITHLAL
jgi:hypothetical protein